MATKFFKRNSPEFNRGRMRKLATEDAIVAVPVVVEPVPVLNPAAIVIVPVDVRDVLGVVSVTLLRNVPSMPPHR